MPVPTEAEARLRRSGIEHLTDHLGARYGLAVSRTARLDLGVLRVDHRSGPSWVARVMPAVRPARRTDDDVAVLRLAAGAGLPAEALPVPDPVSDLEGQAVVVTDFLRPAPPDQRSGVIKAHGGLVAMGDLLGRLAGLDPLGLPPGGAWHHLADGGPGEEIGAAMAQLATHPAADSAEVLADALEDLDDADGLPVGPVHPDPVLRNLVAGEDRVALVDWTGAGVGPRIWPLAWLLFTEGRRNLPRVDRVLAGWCGQVEPVPEELDRLPAIMRARPTVLATWAWCAGRASLRAATRAVADARAQADTISARAVQVLCRRP